jgi:hypothetical protein
MKADRLSLLGATLSENLSSVTKKRKPELGDQSGKTMKSDSKTTKVERSGTSASIETHASTVVYQNCAMYSGSNMSFGATAPPPPPQAPPEQHQSLLNMICNQIMGKFKTDKEESSVQIVAGQQNEKNEEEN